MRWLAAILPNRIGGQVLLLVAVSVALTQAVSFGFIFVSDQGRQEESQLRAGLGTFISGVRMMAVADPADRLIGLALFELVDEAGWLTGDWTALSDQFGTSVERIESVIARVQRLDPPGLFARNLKECLALQLEERNRLDPAMQSLLDHLDRLGAKDMAGLMKICGVDAEDLADMAQSGKPLFGINSTNHERVVIFGGGAPVMRGDRVIGAIGASGGTVDQDVEVVEAAARALEHA